MSDLKTYTCSYPFNGTRYAFEIKAETEAEASARIKQMAWGTVDGELVMRVPAYGTGWLVRSVVALRNFLTGASHS